MRIHVLFLVLCIVVVVRASSPACEFQHFLFKCVNVLLNTANGTMRAATMRQRGLKRKNVHDEATQHNDALKVSAYN